MSVFKKKPELKEERLSETDSLRMQKFILENERITKEASEFNSGLSFDFSKDPITGLNSSCRIKFKDDTGIPYIIFRSPNHRFGGAPVVIELSEMRQIISWLKSRGIE